MIFTMSSLRCVLSLLFTLTSVRMKFFCLTHFYFVLLGHNTGATITLATDSTAEHSTVNLRKENDVLNCPSFVYCQKKYHF